MDNYYVDKPLWRVDLGAEVTVNGAVILTWQGAGQGMNLRMKFVTTYVGTYIITYVGRILGYLLGNK